MYHLMVPNWCSLFLPGFVFFLGSFARLFCRARLKCYLDHSWTWLSLKFMRPLGRIIGACAWDVFPPKWALLELPVSVEAPDRNAWGLRLCLKGSHPGCPPLGEQEKKASTAFKQVTDEGKGWKRVCFGGGSWWLIIEEHFLNMQVRLT